MAKKNRNPSAPSLLSFVLHHQYTFLFMLCLIGVFVHFTVDAHASAQIFACRVAFGTAHGIVFAASALVYARVRAAAAKPPPVGMEAWPKDVPVHGSAPISCHEYDMQEATSMLLGNITPVLFAFLVHWWCVPLFLSGILALRNLHSRPLFMIHVKGAKDIATRPFGGGKANPGLLTMLSDPEMYMNKQTETLFGGSNSAGQRTKRKKLSGKEKRRQRQLMKAKNA
jgi:hypothetical protein